METDFENDLIDLFETSIKAGKSPEIENFLSLWSEESKQRILFELISIEVFHSLKGRPVSNRSYARFGEKAVRFANDLRKKLSLPSSTKMVEKPFPTR